MHLLVNSRRGRTVQAGRPQKHLFFTEACCLCNKKHRSQAFSLSCDKRMHPCDHHPNQNTVTIHQTRKFPHARLQSTATLVTSMTTTVPISIIVEYSACSLTSFRWKLSVPTLVSGFIHSTNGLSRFVHVVAGIICLLIFIAEL